MNSTEHYEPPPDLIKATTTIKALSTNTPFDASFIDYLVGEYLIALVSLRQHLIANSTHPDAPIEISTSTSDKTNQAKADISDLPETIHQLVVTWARDVELETGVRRVIEAVRSGYVDVQEMAEMVVEAERPELSRAILQRIRHWDDWVAGEEGRRLLVVEAEERAEAEQAEKTRLQKEKAAAAQKATEEQAGSETKTVEGGAETVVDVKDTEEEEEKTIHTIEVKDEDNEDEDYTEAEVEEIGSEEEDDGGSVRDELDGDL